jgi:octaprenyl-diphosphate synthase
LQIDAIYEPIKEDLLKVEEGLKDFAQVDFPGMRQLLEHILKSGGKRIRPAIALLVGKFYNYQLDLFLPLATGMELLHIATLVHDDTIDNSLLRRGKPTINSLWGQSAAVLLGDYLFSGAAHLVSSTGNIPVTRLFAQTLMAISSGELQESLMTYNLSQTREDYYQRIAAKTASLFSSAAESGAILGQAPEKAVSSLKDYGHQLGLSFQIVDDILDFTGEEEEMGKPAGSDLIHGNRWGGFPASFGDDS